LREKTFLSQNGFPVAPFWRVASLAELHQAIAVCGVPCILKSAGFGYDGKGQFRIAAPGQAEEAWRAVGEREAVLEQRIDFACEISVVGARTYSGEFVHFGAVENQHENGILDVSIAPARIDARIAARAVEIAHAVLDRLSVVGVLCVEFFVTRTGDLLINELAPRPHNSGHFTFDANVTSQFEQQLRAVCGLPLGGIEQLSPAVMVNLLGDIWDNGEPDWAAAVAMPNVKLHLYGKSEPRPGRKMGHLTALAPTVEQALDDAKRAREILARRFPAPVQAVP
jgi:5-(carboxyamino)imidazole ribonucleotide synthase